MDNGVCYWRCAKGTSPARITTEGNDLKQQTAPHNHAVDVVDTQVKAIQSDMRKRAREEITPVPAIYNDHLIHLSTHSNRDSIALQLPTFTSMKSSLYRSHWRRLPPLPLTRCVRQCACTDIEIDLNSVSLFHTFYSFFFSVDLPSQSWENGLRHSLAILFYLELMVMLIRCWCLGRRRI